MHLYIYVIEFLRLEEQSFFFANYALFEHRRFGELMGDVFIKVFSQPQSKHY